MTDAINIPDGLFRFQVGEHLLVFDPIDAAIEQNRIAQECQALANFEYLDKFRDWLQSIGCPRLGRAQADQVWWTLRLERERVTKLFTDGLRSLIGTDSGPAAE